MASGRKRRRQLERKTASDAGFFMATTSQFRTIAAGGKSGDAKKQKPTINLIHNWPGSLSAWQRRLSGARFGGL
jgi:pimeloyl-ACP methyl ester carboxylesterase